MMHYVAGDQRAFEELYRRYSGKAYGYIAKQIRPAEVAAEVFQHVMLKLHKSREQFQDGRIFSAWFFAICRSAIVDHFRRSSRQVATTELDDNNTPAEVSQLVEHAWMPDLAIASLTADQQKALRLRFESGLEFDDIARQLATSQENARQLVSRAVRKLKSLLGGRLD